MLERLLATQQTHHRILHRIPEHEVTIGFRARGYVPDKRPASPIAIRLDSDITTLEIKMRKKDERATDSRPATGGS